MLVRRVDNRGTSGREVTEPRRLSGGDVSEPRRLSGGDASEPRRLSRMADASAEDIPTLSHYHGTHFTGFRLIVTVRNISTLYRTGLGLMVPHTPHLYDRVGRIRQVDFVAFVSVCTVYTCREGENQHS